jgi:hypothetical protein
MICKILFIALASLFSLSNVSGAYLQLSSTVTQTNGAFGTGVAITYNSIDATDNGMDFVSGESTITIKTAGTYFIIAAPQVGSKVAAPGLFGRLFRGSNSAKFSADYYVVQNGAAVANSNVRITADAGSQDVIVTQGVYILAAGDKIQIYGAGPDTFSEYIAPNGAEPAIPSIITTIYKI